MAGAGYKLFNTGDVLTAAQVNTYLMEQTVMVFADAAARTAALSGVVSEGMISYLKDTNAVEVYDGSNWVASDDPNAIQNTIVDAKGDLISASAADTPARLAVGNNGETLVADSSASTGLRWQGNFAAGKNKIINGDFRINQRNFTSITGGYGFDRWGFELSGATGTMTLQTFTAGTAPVSGYEAINFARATITTGNDFARIVQNIEDVRTLAGQTATVSFWAKGTNPTTAGNLKVLFQQNFGTGGSPSASVTVPEQTFVLTANWTRYSLTFEIPSIAGKTIGTNNNSYLQFQIGQGSSTSTDSWTLDLWGVQVEAGSVATPFQTATGTLAGELAAASRYYQRLSANGAYTRYGLGFGSSSTNVTAAVFPPVVMRTAPSSVDFSTLAVSDGVSAPIAVTNVVLNDPGAAHWGINLTATGITNYRPYYVLSNNSTAGYLGFSAEL